LDASLLPVPIGVEGELYVGGIQLARGYLHRPALTAERFIPDPFANGERLYRTGDLARWRSDGNLEFLGRLDDHVKIRGYRIELGEIEAALLSCPAVAQAVAVAREQGPGDKRLIAYVVGTRKEAFDARELRTYLNARLPQYMIPSAFVALPSFPVTPNGKLDRNALPAPEARSEEYVAPRNRSELALQRIWEDLLRVSPISVRDNFFALGGHSLLAASLIANCNRAFAVELPIRSLFDHPTIETLAISIRQGRPRDDYRALVALQTAGTRRPLFCIHPAGGSAFCYVALANCLGSDQPGLRPASLRPRTGRTVGKLGRGDGGIIHRGNSRGPAARTLSAAGLVVRRIGGL
jgi:hypothetical protein